MWQLYTRRLCTYYREYAWLSPAGIIAFNRHIAPLGFLDSPFFVDKTGQPRAALKSNEGWRKANHRMNQEQLAQGWLC